ncbi:hypothetical protein DFH08DRAFT_1089719 [Mycena albidolilacea]|uniref:Uncharacterized protein n=1 Tax=Mycena albidolilacea TaxID=1033008 RepID=A0AAD6Z161_9AGAR|nr:hypothetical protein DFH08DRAFT_1089719 [Mycena albidolilacea]
MAIQFQSPTRARRARPFCRIASRCRSAVSLTPCESLRLHMLAALILRRRESSSHCVYAECPPTLRTYIANNVFHHPEQNESQRRRYRRPGSAASAAPRLPLTHIATNTSDYVVHPTNMTVRPVQRGISTVALLAPPPTHLSHPTSLRPPPPVAAAAI